MLIGYARVETREPTTAPLDALEAAGCERVFEENAAEDERARPQLQAALDYLRQGDTLVVWQLDQLAWSFKRLYGTVQNLERRGIGFRSLMDDLDTTTDDGQLIFRVFASLARFERSISRQRIVAGQKAAREQGRVPGRQRAFQPEDLRRLRQLLKTEGISVVEAARRMDVSPATVYRYLPGGKRAVTASETEADFGRPPSSKAR